MQLCLHGGVRIVGQQAGEAGQVDRAVPVHLLAVEIVDNHKFFLVRAARVREHRRMFHIERRKVAVCDHIVLLAQRDQLAIVGEDGARVVDLAGGIDGFMVGVHADPRLGLGEAAALARVPLHGGAAVVARMHAQDVVRAVLMQAAVTQDVEVIDALHVAVLVERGKARVGHADLLALVDVGRAAQAVDDRAQHLGRGLPVLALVAEARDHARLVMVAPEHRVPCVVVAHAGLPGEQDVLELVEIERYEHPFLIAHKVHLEVVERERHAQFTGVRACVLVAVVHGRG